MKDIALSQDLLNSSKILFHYGKMLEDISRGKEDFTPIAIEIHPTAVCNHRCIHCSYKERNENRDSLSAEVMDRLIDSVVAMGIRAVYFSGGGEPTLYPGLADYINRLAEHGIECSIITNASCFAEMGLVPIANKLNYIAISVPAIDETTFETITGTNNLSKVLALPQIIKEYHGEHSPIIGSRVVLTNKNYKCVDDFLQVIREKKFDYVLFKIVRDYEDNGQGLNAEEERYLQNVIDEHQGIDDNFTNLRFIFNYRKNPQFIHKCWVNQFGMIANVSTDGRVYPNIVEIDKEEFCIGNLYETDLKDMWNGDRHRAVKELSNRKWISGQCRNCRAIAYNNIINSINVAMPRYFDPFI